MDQARAYSQKAMDQGQPRRYIVRRLTDSLKLTEREVAEVLDVAKTTIHRDLADTMEPAGFTANGTPYYPQHRFDSDLDYRERVAQLTHDMPASNAKLEAARQFAGPVDRYVRPLNEGESEEARSQRLARLLAFAKQHGPKAA